MVNEARRTDLDELVELHKRLKPHAEAIKRYEALRKKVREWPKADKIAGNAEVSYMGTKGAIVLGQCEHKRDWKPGAVKAICEALGQARFVAIAGVTITAATAAMGETAIADLLAVERTGSRDITILAKAERKKAA